MRFPKEENDENGLVETTRLWTDDRRGAAIRELEHRFRMQISEQDVFRAATLFFGLLTDGAFIDKEEVARRVRSESANAQAAYGETDRRQS